MSVIRAFVAIELSPEIHKRLDQVMTQLKQRLPGVPVRWVLATNVHLTLKFLGDVSVANLGLLKDVLLKEAISHRPFEISVGGIGAFPNARRPHVVWIGVEAPPALGVVQSGIENELARLGYAREDRTFSPHLTLGRVPRNTSNQDVHQIAEVLDATKVGFLGAVRVAQVNIFQSVLQPSGAVYTKIFTAPLSEE